MESKEMAEARKVTSTPLRYYLATAVISFLLWAILAWWLF